MTSETRLRQLIRAPRATVYAALLDPEDVSTWMVPDGMTSRIHRFEPYEGGRFRISLTYDSPDAVGKTAAQTDTYSGQFVRLVLGREVVQTIEFETDAPDMQGAMTVILTLEDAEEGTELLARHLDVPRGISPADNELGWRLSLAKLARLVEDR